MAGAAGALRRLLRRAAGARPLGATRVRGLGALTAATRPLRTAAATLGRPARGPARALRGLGGMLPVPARTPRRLLELAAGLAVLPLGAALSVGLAAPAGSAPRGAPAGRPAESLLRFHGTVMPHAQVPAAGIAGPPILEVLPEAPVISRLAAQGVPAPVPGTSYSAAAVEAIITAAAQADGVSPTWMISTAECESGLRANAYNPSGPYYGIFQFVMSTFRAHGGTDIWDPTQQAQIAASMFASGDSVAWPVCSRR